MANDLIGMMDSGVGGVSVLHAAVQLMPNEHFLYYGDCLHAPYGPKSLNEIQMLSEKALKHLIDKGVKAIVIACNTATSAYAEIARSTLSIPIIGMEPAIKPAQLSRNGGIVLALATKATLSLPKFRRLMDRYGENVVPVVGEGLVELIEGGKAESPETDETLERIFAPYRHLQVDSVVLGCTHYPFVKQRIRAIFPDAHLFDGRMGTARQLRHVLEANDLLTKGSQGSVRFETSGDEEQLALMMRLYDALPDEEI